MSDGNRSTAVAAVALPGYFIAVFIVIIIDYCLFCWQYKMLKNMRKLLCGLTINSLPIFYRVVSAVEGDIEEIGREIIFVYH